MTSTFRRLGQSELLPRYIFAESLFVRRRVLEVGAVAATGGKSAEFLVTRGARLVVACDDDLAAVQEAQKSLGSAALRFRSKVLDDLEPASFDLVLVADLAPYVAAPTLLAELARLVASTGHLLGGLRNPAGLSLAQLVEPEEKDAPPTYGQLLDALSPHFPSVEVATQSPVLGYQLAFEGGEGLQVDGSLARSSEAAYFVVLAGRQALRPFDPTWVQLSPEPLAFGAGRLDEYAQRTRGAEERTARLKEALEKERQERAQKEQALEALNAEQERALEEVARLSAQLEAGSRSLAEERDRDELAVRIRRAELEAASWRDKYDEAQAAISRLGGELEVAGQARAEAVLATQTVEQGLRAERARAEELHAVLEEAKAHLAQGAGERSATEEQVERYRTLLERQRLELERVQGALGASHEVLEEARQQGLDLAQGKLQAEGAAEALRGELSVAAAELERVKGELLSEKAALVRAEESSRLEHQAAQEAAAALEAARAEQAQRLEQERESVRREVEAPWVARAEALGSEIESLKVRTGEDIERVRREAEAQAAQAAEATKRAEALATELEAVQSGVREHQARAETDRGRATELAAKLNEELARVRDELSETEVRRQALEQEAEKLQLLLVEKERSGVDLERVLAQTREEREREQQSAQRRLEDAEGARQRLAEEREQLSKARTEADHAREEADHARAEAEHGREEADQAREKADRAREKHASELEELQTKLAALSTHVEALTAERKDFETQLQASKHECHERGDQVQQLEAKRQRLEQTSESFQKRLASQETELAALRKILARPGPSQVQQIYERAAGQLSAVRSEIHRKGGPGPAPDLENPPPAVGSVPQAKPGTKPVVTEVPPERQPPNVAAKSEPASAPRGELPATPGRSKRR